MPKDYQLTVAVQRQVTVTEMVTIRLNRKQIAEAAGLTGAEDDFGDDVITDVITDRAVEILKIRHNAAEVDAPKNHDWREREAQEAALGSVGITEIQAPNALSYDFMPTMVLDSRTGFPFGTYAKKGGK